MLPQTKKKRPPSAVDLACACGGVSKSYVQRALKLQREAPDLFDRLKSGEMNIPAAMRALRARQGEPPIPKRINVSADPVEAIQVLWHRWSDDDRKAAVVEVSRLIDEGCATD